MVRPAVQEILQQSFPGQQHETNDGVRTRRAIVTGGTTGIGRYSALLLAKDGCDVAVTYAHDPEEAELTAEAIRQLGRKAYVQKLDTSATETVGPAVDQMVADLGGLDIFVNNAGMMVNQQLLDLQIDKLNLIFNVNVFGAILAIQRGVRHMLGLKPTADQQGTVESAVHSVRRMIEGRDVAARQTPGRIILITSVHEHVASPVDIAYTMTKHALGGLVKCAALELGRYNITVNAVAPGEIATPMNDMKPEESTESTRKNVPMGRVGHPLEVADAVRFLASDRSSFITGTSYLVDGGFIAMTPLAHPEYSEA